MESFIYHGVPQDLKGDTLMPLFDLKDIYPDLYEQQIKKYTDHPKRKNLPFKNIPLINCKRGEVLHNSSIHPYLVFMAMKSVFPHFDRSILFYKIPMKSLLNRELVFFDMNHPKYEFGLESDPEVAFKLINPSLYNEVKEVPKEAYEFFQEWKNRGEHGAPAWGKIPHVFVKGSIDITGFEIIDWRKPI